MLIPKSKLKPPAGLVVGVTVGVGVGVSVGVSVGVCVGVGVIEPVVPELINTKPVLDAHAIFSDKVIFGAPSCIRMSFNSVSLLAILTVTPLGPPRP